MPEGNSIANTSCIDTNQKKTFCLDASIFIHDPFCLEKFEEHNIVIPAQVIEDLDRAKEDKKSEIRGFAANLAITNLDRLCRKKRENLKDGIKTSGGGIIKFIPGTKNTKKILELPGGQFNEKTDNVILATVKELQKNGKNVTLVSLSSTMHVKASGYGVPIEEYKYEKKHFEKEKYSGFKEIILNKNKECLLTNLREKGSVPISVFEKNVNVLPEYANQCCKIRSISGDQYELAIYKKHEKDSKFVFVEKPAKEKKEGIILPLDDRQSLFVALLNDPTIKIITVMGKAGSGKSLLTLNYAYEQLLKKGFTKIDVYRIMRELQEMGFLPGGVSEKFAPWEKPIADNLDLILPFAKNCERHVQREEEILLQSRKKRKKQNAQENHFQEVEKGKETGFDFLVRTKKLEVNPISYLLGRTLHNRILIFDEFQNTSRSIMKVCVARAGQNTKLIINGDIDQIIEDSKGVYVDQYTNGLVHLVNTLKGQDIFGCIELNGESKRSDIAELSSFL